MSLETTGRVRSSASYNRRRAGNACLVCRSRKTKCDNQRPVCGFCAVTGGNCQYVDSDPSQFDRASLTILQRLSQLELNVINHIDDSLRQLGTNGSATPEQAIQSPMDPSPEHHKSPWATRQSARSVSTLQPPSSGSFDREAMVGVSDQMEGDTRQGLLDDMPPSSQVVLQTSEMFLDCILRWPIFSQAAPNLEQNLQSSTLEAWKYQTTPVRHPKAVTLQGTDSDVVMQLVENFLAHNHTKNPILDIVLLRKDAREFAESGPQWDGKSCLILLVCAVSSLQSPLSQETELGPSKDKDRLERAEAYFQASQRRIGMLYHENSLVAAQCSFLTAVYLMSTVQVLAAWKCLVQAGTQCLAWLKSQGRMKGMGTMHSVNLLRTEGSAEDIQVSTTRHAEDSLYWSCLKSELELRFELGLPGSGLNEVQYQNLFPSPPINLEQTHDTSSYQTLEKQWSSPGSSFTSNDKEILELGWFFYLAEIALKRILHNVVTWICKSKSHRRGNGMTEEAEGDDLEIGVAEFEMQSQEWYTALPSKMKFPLQTDQPTGDILRFILRGHMLDIREVIRFPAISALLSSTSSISTWDFSSTYHRLARELLDNAVERIKANREGWYHRHQGTWLMMRSCSRSALHLLGVALKCQQSALTTGESRSDLERLLLPPKWKEAVGEVVDLVDYWADESEDIRRLSNIFRELMVRYESAAE